MQSVLITGSNSGIGRAAALRLAMAGYRVYAAMRDLSKAKKLLDLAREAGCAVEPLELDVTDAGSVRRAIGTVCARPEGLDILINNAGIGWNAAIEDVDVDAARVVFDTNYWGTLRCIHAALPHMRERGSGQIVNVSSIAGRIAALAQTVYASSKWALECLSENLAQEVAPFGIRVVIIEPGVTRTAILPKNVGHPEPTAYETAYRRMLQFYLKGIEANVAADTVADTILDALTDDAPRLRYACGWGGSEIAEGRARMTDAEWIALGRCETDEEYYDAFERHLGLDLRPSS
ncbi:MAG: SDR family oxidoreductase [Myxococcota bacterium]